MMMEYNDIYIIFRRPSKKRTCEGQHSCSMASAVRECSHKAGIMTSDRDGIGLLFAVLSQAY